MQHTLETVQAENRALQRAQRRPQLMAMQLPDPALIRERTADHGEDSNREFRTETATRLNALVDAVRRIHANPVLRPTEKVLSIAADVEAKAKIIAADFEGQRYLLSRLHTELETATDAALRAPRPEWDGKAIELRGVLRAMTDDQRYSFLDQVKGTRDEAFVRFAIASVPPAVSGYSIGIHKEMVDTTLGLKDPTLLSKPRDLQLRAERLKHAEDGFKRTIADLVDADQAAALRQLIGDSA